MIVLNNDVYNVLKMINDFGYQGYLVGGASRDLILGLKPNDYDICTDALPNEIINIFDKYEKNINGYDYGSITVYYSNKKFEITTFREEKEYNDKRHPTVIKYVKKLKKDVLRRDFTINAIMLDKDGNIYDYCNGYKDLEVKTIKAIGDPNTKMKEDAIRIIRALRLVSKYGFNIEENTFNAMSLYSKNINLLKKEIVNEEIRKVFLGRYIYTYSYVCDILKEYLQIFKVIDFNNYRDKLKKCSNNLLLRFGIMYYYNINYLEEIKLIINNKNKFNLLRNGLNEAFLTKFDKKSTIKQAIFRNFSYNGYEVVKLALNIQYCNGDINRDTFSQLLAILRDVKNDCYTLKDLKINGNDLIKIGITDGLKIKKILNNILVKVVNDEIENNKDILLKLAFAKI